MPVFFSEVRVFLFHGGRVRMRLAKNLGIICIIMSLFACGGGGGSSSPEEGNHIPSASAGTDQSVKTNSVVTLSAAESSDPQGNPLTYAWVIVEKPQGSQASLSDPFEVRPTFTPDLDGIYVIALVVSNGTDESSEDLTTITASTANSAPMADAGADRNVATGTLVTLDGSGSSDADGDQITYFWSFESMPDGSTAALSDPTAAKPTFTPDAVGDYVLLLITNDGFVDSAAVTITITATASNVAPVANAGSDRSVATGDIVALDASGSYDSEGDQLTYLWTFVTIPSGSSASFSDNTSTAPTFVPDLDGNYVVRLIVNDGDLDSAAVTITISAATVNAAPVADAGTDRNAMTGVALALDGSASYDANDDTLSYQWSFVSLPPGSMTALSDPTAVSPSFTPDVDGDYVLSLVVNDGQENSVAHTVTITATTPSPANDTTIARWPYNISEIRMERDDDSDGIVDGVSTQTFSYDAEGRVTRYIQRPGDYEEFFYSGENIARVIEYENGNIVDDDTFIYDGNGNLAEIADSNGIDIVYGYTGDLITYMNDSNSEISNYTHSDDRLILTEEFTIPGPYGSVALDTYTYDDQGNLTNVSWDGLSYDGHGETNYFYDENGKLARIEKIGWETLNIFYDESGRLNRVEENFYGSIFNYYFTFNERGYPTSRIAEGSPYFRDVVMPLVPQIVDRFID